MSSLSPNGSNATTLPPSEDKSASSKPVGPYVGISGLRTTASIALTVTTGGVLVVINDRVGDKVSSGWGGSDVISDPAVPPTAGGAGAGPVAEASPGGTSNASMPWMMPLLAMMSGMITLAPLIVMPVSDTITETVAPERVGISPLVIESLEKRPGKA